MSPLPWQGHDDNKDKGGEEVEIEPLSETKGEKKKRSKLKESEKKADSRTKAKAKAATKKVRDNALRDNLKQKATELKETKDALKSVTEKFKRWKVRNPTNDLTKQHNKLIDEGKDGGEHLARLLHAYAVETRDTSSKLGRKLVNNCFVDRNPFSFGRWSNLPF